MSQLKYTVKSVQDLRAEIETAAAQWDLAPGTRFETASCSGVSCDWITADSELESAAVYLHFHGGGYYRGSSRVDAAICSFLCSMTGGRCLSVNYRRPPDEGVFPAALDDAVQVYRWLTDPDAGAVAASNIVVGGTSAGGGLCLSLLLKLRAQELSMPAAVIAVSPWTDLTQSGLSFETNAEHGPARDYLAHWAGVYLDDHDARDPFASPLFGDLRGLPPMLIQAGGHETMLDDATAFAAAAARAGCRVDLNVFDQKGHSFQHNVSTDGVAHEAVKGMARFIDRWTRDESLHKGPTR